MIETASQQVFDRVIVKRVGEPPVGEVHPIDVEAFSVAIKPDR